MPTLQTVSFPWATLNFKTVLFVEFLMKLVNEHNQKYDCDCLPTCDDVNYIIEFMDILDW